MFIPCDLQPNEVGYYKLIRTESVRDRAVPNDQNSTASTLTIEGISAESEVLFQYKNKE